MNVPDTNNTTSQTHRVLYVTSRFPALSLTFVANEMKAVTDLGCHVEVFSLWKGLDSHKGHPVERPFIERTQYADWLESGNLLRMCKALVKRPSVLVTFLRLIPGHLKSPWLFAKLWGSLPKGLVAGILAEEKNCTHIHAHFLTMPTTVALLASKVSGIPYTATAHAFDITSTHPQWVNGSVSYKCREAAAIVTISQYNKVDITTRWPELSKIRIDVIYNGIDTGTFSARSTEAPYRKKDDPLNIVSISNLNEKKGFHYLIEAATILLDEGRSLLLDIYGDGPLREELQKQIDLSGHGASIKLNGSIKQQDVVYHCQQADMFVVASIPLATGDADGLPTVLIESLGSELPSISTQVTGIPEIVINNVTGLCVPPADSQALAEAIAYMSDNPEQALEMAKAGRKLVLEKFDQTDTSRQLAALWTDCSRSEPASLRQ